jgi:formylmethanofuran dehydrogenase subunit C
MSGLTLAFRGDAGTRVDLSDLLPETLAALDADAVARRPLATDRGTVPLGELFSVAAEGEAGQLRIRPEGAVLDRVGARMGSGLIEVEGDVGSLAGAQMSGGTLRIQGNAGDRLGGVLPGETKGMRGGLILLSGDAGDRLGERLRRGTISVDGRAGADCGAFMTAGTVAVAGGCGPRAGFGMRRGSLIFGTELAETPAGFVDAGLRDWVFLRLLKSYLAETGSWLASRSLGRARRYIGNRAEQGLGEILVLP